MGAYQTDVVDPARQAPAPADIDDTGPVTSEASSAVVAPGLSNDLAIWRDLWTDGEDLARHARSFMADQLTAGRR